MSLQDLNISNTNRLKMFTNGQEVIDFLQNLLAYVQNDDQEESQAPRQPVTLVLLDINMPILNGLETMKLIKEMF